MSVLIVYESMWGNTRDIAEAVQQGLGEGELVDVGDAPATVPEDVDFLVLGGPTHALSMSRSSTRHDAVDHGAPPGHEERGLREWLAAMAPSDHLDVATFDTRATSARHLPGSAARSAGKQVRKHHLGRLVDTESFYVDDMAGPLHEGELARARRWGSSLRFMRNMRHEISH
jgi:hypothetical protein